MCFDNIYSDTLLHCILSKLVTIVEPMYNGHPKSGRDGCYTKVAVKHR